MNGGIINSITRVHLVRTSSVDIVLLFLVLNKYFSGKREHIFVYISLHTSLGKANIALSEKIQTDTLSFTPMK
jgi:hypothetical protein